VRLPDGILGAASRGPDWAAWVERLPRLLAELHDEWELRPDGWMMHGYCAVVEPVLTATGRTAVLKVSFPHEEAEHEHLALARWGGDGAVDLWRADPRRRAMLLERLRDVTLGEAWDVEACRVVGELHGRLHVPAPKQLRTLSSYVERVLDRLRVLPRDAPLPRRLVEQAASLARDFVADARTDGTLVHTDLHYGNVLAGDREAWLAIDPKPLSGDPHYEPAPMLWNRFEELRSPQRAESVRNGVRRRFHTIVDTAGLDEDRARDWVVVRMVANAVDALADGSKDDDGDWITTCVAIAKAVQG
jgi:streptomycin 6-kinase